MKEIILTQGLTTQVDDWNYDWLNQWDWYAMKSYNGFYAVRGITLSTGKQKTIYMHKVILNIINQSEGDHIDRNKLNNQEFNLRCATHNQNLINRRYNNSSGYRGVVYRKDMNKYRVILSIDNKQHYFGYFDDPIEAAKKYDILAKKHHGEFANLNFPNIINNGL